MNRILPAFVIAMFVHLSFFKMDLEWLLIQDRVTPQTQVTTMHLVQRSPIDLPAMAPLPLPPTPLPPEPKPALKKPPVRKTIAKPKPAAEQPKTIKPKIKPTPKPAPLPPAPHQAAAARPPESIPQPEAVPEPPSSPVAHQRNATNPASPREKGSSTRPNDTPIEEQSSSGASTAVVMARPRYSENPTPAYPSMARKRRYQGTVILEVLVKEDGRVGELRVAKTSKYSMLDRAAMKAVRSWLFEPARRGNHEVAMWVKVPIQFYLE